MRKRWESRGRDYREEENERQCVCVQRLFTISVLFFFFFFFKKKGENPILFSKLGAKTPIFPLQFLGFCILPTLRKFHLEIQLTVIYPSQTSEGFISCPNSTSQVSLCSFDLSNVLVKQDPCLEGLLSPFKYSTGWNLLSMPKYLDPLKDCT